MPPLPRCSLLPSALCSAGAPAPWLPLSKRLLGWRGGHSSSGASLLLPTARRCSIQPIHVGSSTAAQLWPTAWSAQWKLGFCHQPWALTIFTPTPLPTIRLSWACPPTCTPTCKLALGLSGTEFRWALAHCHVFGTVQFSPARGLCLANFAPFDCIADRMCDLSSKRVSPGCLSGKNRGEKASRHWAAQLLLHA